MTVGRLSLQAPRMSCSMAVPLNLHTNEGYSQAEEGALCVDLRPVSVLMT